MRFLVISVTLALMLWPAEALAYFDPGSGAVLLQLLVAAVIGGAYRLRRAISAVVQSIVAFFRR